MNLIYRKRQTGKTSDLIKLAAETRSYLVSFNRPFASNALALARHLGIDMPFPIAWDDLRRGAFTPRGIQGFVIDDVDYILRSMAKGVPIIAAAMTSDEQKEVVHVEPAGMVDYYQREMVNAQEAVARLTERVAQQTRLVEQQQAKINELQRALEALGRVGRAEQIVAEMRMREEG